MAFALSLLLFLHTVSLSVQCAPFLCGFGFGGCYPAPPPLLCPVCSAGFVCAPTAGVCVSRARLHSALTQDAGPEESHENPTNVQRADKEFRTCCELGSMPDGCLHKCSYNEYNRRNVQTIALGMDACPASALPILHACAAHHSDHKKCCMQKSIFSEPFYVKCKEICKAEVDSVVRFDISYLPCFESFDRLVSECFLNYTLTVSTDF